jgi:ribonuclease P protein component
MSHEAAGRLRLPRTRRMHGAREFALVRDCGLRRAQGCLAINWLPLDEAHSKLGVVTSRKLGKATVRSRARRLMREAFRRQQNHLQRPVAIVLIARHSIVGKSFAAVERDFVGLLKQAKLLK